MSDDKLPAGYDTRLGLEFVTAFNDKFQLKANGTYRSEGVGTVTNISDFIRFSGPVRVVKRSEFDITGGLASRNEWIGTEQNQNQPNTTTMTKVLYLISAIYNPKPVIATNGQDNTPESVLIVQPKYVLSGNADEAHVILSRLIPEEYMDKLDQVSKVISQIK